MYNFTQRREYETLEINGEIYHAYRQDIGTIVVKKMGD